LAGLKTLLSNTALRLMGELRKAAALPAAWLIFTRS